MNLNKKNNLLITFSLIISLLIIAAFFIIFMMPHGHKSYLKEKERIIKEFNENYQYFSYVQKYIIEQKGAIYISKKEGKVVFWISGKSDNSNNPFVKRQAEYIINTLHFKRIYRDVGPAQNGRITFLSTTDDSVDEGIMYIPDDSGREDLGLIKIRSCWYFFYFPLA